MNGAEKRQSVWSGWATREEAEAAIIGVLSERGDVDAPVRDMRTVFDLLDYWVGELQRRVDRSPRTIRHRRYCAQHLGKSDLGRVALGRISARAIEDYRDQALRAGRAPSTVREDLTTLRAAWRWARERGHVADRDLPRVQVRVRPQDAVYNRYTPGLEEVDRVLGYLRRWEWAWRTAYLLWATGARRQEIAELRWDDVDLDAGLVQLVGKTGPRQVPLHPQVVREMETWSRETDHVHGVAISTAAGSLNERLRRACQDLELPRWSAHGLRRAAVVRLYRGGVDPAVAGAIMGHSPKVALEHYRQVAADDLADAVLRTGMGVLPAGEVITLRRER